MNLSSIEAFCLVVKLGNISKAAKALHISQPALSLQIQELENYFNAVLLERGNKGVKPTETGEILYEYGQKLLTIADNLKKEISRKNSIQDDIIVAAASTVGQFALPCTIFIYQEKYPQVHINTKITNTQNVITQLLEGSVDFGLLEGPISDNERQVFKKEGLAVQLLGRDELVIIAPYDEHWAGVELISQQEFKKLPWILREPGSGIRTSIEKKLATENMDINKLNIIAELDQTNAIISAVTNGKGFSLLPRISIKKHLHYKTLKAIRLENCLFYHSISLAYRPKKIKSVAASSFLHLLSSKERGFC